MASAVSEWTTIGTNTGNPAAQGLNVPIVAGTKGHVRHECLMWLDGTSAIYTKPIDWVINGDFTVILNGTLNVLDDDPGAVDVDVQGSLDGGTDNWVKLADLATWNAGYTVQGGADPSTVGHGVYDYDASGRMPFMRLSLNPGSDSDSVAVDENLKITVVMHNG